MCHLTHRATASPEHVEKPSLFAGETMVQCAMREVWPESKVAGVRRSLVLPLLQWCAGSGRNRHGPPKQCWQW